MNRSKRGALLGTSLALVLSAQAAHGAESRPVDRPPLPTEPSTHERDRLEQELAEQAKLLAELKERLALEMRKLEDTQRRVHAIQRRLGPPAEVDPAPLAHAEGAALSGRSSEGAPRADPTLDVATVFSQPSILTPKGSFVLEPSLQYAFSSSDRVSILGYSVLNAVLIGQIDVRSVNRSTWTAAVTGRYGLTNRLEIEARLPFLYRSDDTVTRSVGEVARSELFSSDGAGLGDIELAARYQINVPRPDGAFYVAGLRLKTRTGRDQYEVDYDPNFNLPNELPTGSGFFSLQPSLSAVLPTDPVVFFGGINYVWNIKRDVDATIPYQNNLVYYTQHIGEVDPGDSIGFNFGMGLGLNERSSFSLSYEHTWIDKTEIDGSVASEALAVQLATLQVGFSYRLNKRANLNLSIGAGLTEDTPDTTLTLRVPMRF